MAELSKEQQQAIAKARARQRQQTSRPASEVNARKGPEESKMAFFNKALAQTVGAPVDVTNALLGVVGLEQEKPFGGSESIREGMAGIGAPTPERAPETMGERIASGTGEAAGFVLPAAAIAKRYQAAKGIGGQIASGFNRELVEKPIRSVGGELAAGAGVGVGRDIAEQNELGTTGQFAAEMIGGLAPSAAMMSPTLAAAKLGKRGAEKLGAKAFVPFTSKGAEARAARRIQELSDNPEEAIDAIERLSSSGLSPAGRTGQEGLLDLEDAVLRGDPARARQMSQRTSESLEELQDAILTEGREVIGKPKQLMDARKKRAVAALDARVERATDEATQSLEALGDVSPEEATLAVRGSLEKALNDAKVEENRLWNRIPQNAKAPITKTKDKFKQLKKGLASAQSEDMPASARKVLGGDEKVEPQFLDVLDARGNRIEITPVSGGRTTIKELDGLYKKLGEEATQARAAKDFNKARIAEELRESILDDIAQAEGGPVVQETIQTARAFSKQLNEKFRKGPAGKILGYGREGGPALAPELGLEKTMGTGKQAGELARRSIARATQDDPTAMEGMQNYIKGQFMRNVVDDGQVNPSRAQTFIRNNKELLDAFPGLRQQLTAAKTTEDVRRRVTKQADFFRRKIEKPEVGTASKVLNSTVGDEMDRIFSRSNDDPAATMRAVKRSLAKDKTGEAMKGFKSGASEWLFKQATPQGPMGIVNGTKVLKILRDPVNSRVFKQIYTPSEMARIKRTAEIMQKFQKQQATNRQKINVLNDRPAWMLNALAGVLGARAGSQVARGSGYGNIQIPGIFASTARDITRRLTADKAAQMLSDAIEDEKLFKALLEYRPLQKNRSAIQRNKKYEKTLKAWMAGPGSRLFDDEEGDEMESTAQ